MPVRRAVLALAALLVAAGCSSSAHRSPASTPSSSRSAQSSVTTSPGAAGTTVAASSLVATTETWVLPAPVSRPVVVPDGTGFVVLGGLATGDTSTSRVVQVDPGAGQGQLAGHLALAVHDAAGATIDGRYFVFGGGSYSTVSIVQAWTPSGGTEVGHLPTARSDLSATSLDGVTYIAGGFDGTAMTGDVLQTEDGVTFSVVGHLAVPVRYAAIAAADGALWVIGGVTSTGEGGTAETDAIQKLDLHSGQVTVTGRLPQPLGHAAGFVLGGQIFVVGGRSGGTPSSAIWRLDPGSGTVQPAGQLPEPVSDAGSVVVRGVGYLVGGEVTGPSQPLDKVVMLQPR